MWALNQTPPTMFHQKPINVLVKMCYLVCLHYYNNKLSILTGWIKINLPYFKQPWTQTIRQWTCKYLKSIFCNIIYNQIYYQLYQPTVLYQLVGILYQLFCVFNKCNLLQNKMFIKYIYCVTFKRILYNLEAYYSF